MNNRKDTIFVTILVLFSFGLLVFLNSTTSFAFGGGSDQYTYGAKNIVCGNKACEQANLELKTGEEKSIRLGEKTYRLKLVKIEKIPDKSLVQQPDGTTREETYYRMEILISIDGSEPMQPHEAKEKVGLEVNGYSADEKGDSARFDFYEDKICMVPDCGFRVEKIIYQKWNLVPMYLLGIGDTGNLQSKETTCKQEDFLVVYIHDPVKKEYIKLYSYGQTEPVPTPSSDWFQKNGIFALTPFNSVWAYAKNECKLVMNMPKQFENLLLLLQQLVQLAESQSSQPVAQPLQPPSIEKEISPVAEVKEVTVTSRQISSSASNGKIGFAPGWNFFMGSRDMEDQPLSEIRGTCEIEKAYNFDAKTQSWLKLTKGVGPSEAFLFKTKNKCMLGLTALLAPPSIPVSGG